MGTRRKPRKSKKQTEQSASKWRPVIIWGAIIAGIVFLGYLLFITIQGPAPLEAIKDLVKFRRQPRDHIEGELASSDLPPAGGSHGQIWQNCGIYDEPISAESALHSLEHGAMWLTYQPDLPQGDVETLRNQVRGENYVVMSPYPGLKSPVVLTAWEVQLELDSVDDDRLQEFIERYQQGPTTPERGATCQNGVGTPIQ